MLSFLDRFDAAGFPSSCREVDLYRSPKKDAMGFYALVGLCPSASDEEVKSAFRRELRKYHPDGTEPDREKFEQIEKAYRTLTEDRVAYDNLEEPPEEPEPLTQEERDAFQDLIEREGRDTAERLVEELIEQKQGWSFYCLGPCEVNFDIAQEWYELALPFLADHGICEQIILCLVPGLEDAMLDSGVLMVPAESPKISTLIRALG